MLSILLALFIFLYLSSSVPPAVRAANDTAPISTATTEGRLAVFDDAWERINERYYDQTFHGLDWNAQRTMFRAEAAKAESPRELYVVLRRMIGSLNDPHTRVFAPDEKFDWWRPKFVTTGFSVVEVAGLPTVINVDPKSPAHRAGIKAGDVIETIDGQPAATVIRNAIANLPQPVSAGARFRAFAKLLDGPGDTTVDVAWLTKTGNARVRLCCSTGSNASWACG
jgi:carboxyl-terminal processing protease